MTWIEPDRESIDALFEGVLIPVHDIGGDYSVPGWRCRACGWTVGAQGLPGGHECVDEALKDG